MAREAATSLDVAKLAGVSQSAVSRVFTPGASVSPRMADKVRVAADALGYRPNILARSLITGRSKIIGLVVAYFENQFYPEAVEKLSHALQAEGYHVLIFMATLTADNVDQLLEELLDYQVDGIVMASVSMSSELTTRCCNAGIPVVLFNRSQDDERLSAVTSENHTGGRRVAEFLLAGGHQRIGYIAGWEGASTQRDREQGFLDGLADAGVSLFAREVGNFHFDLTQQAARRMFEKPVLPDAVFVANDHMALAVMETVRSEFGLSVPEDVSVVGYDDVGLASWPSFALTTVRQPSNRMVDETVKILMTQISTGKFKPRRVAIDGPLIVRKSARIPEGWPL
uniref:LacI family DNA-binding transcriptional regulator n=1 Tax=Pararhizobium sp. IMCC3301 TaxID=3067904 RepID=UPI002740543A|nr:LacI family DNA-binding transcriptional regulator [Pararhizobium sp. IMCC3301]